MDQHPRHPAKEDRRPLEDEFLFLEDTRDELEQEDALAADDGDDETLSVPSGAAPDHVRSPFRAFPIAGPSPATPFVRPWMIGVGATALIALSAGAMILQPWNPGPAPVQASTATEGTLVVSSDRPLAGVFIDGKAQGTTPLALPLAPGKYRLEVRNQEGESEEMMVVIEAGRQLARHVELGRPAVASASANGALQIDTEPGGLSVSVDGTSVGRTPVTVSELRPGKHAVSMTSAAGRVERLVEVQAGATAALFVRLATEGMPIAGWVKVTVPFEVAILEEGRLLGTSESDRLMLLAGRHTLQLTAEAVGYSATHTVVVSPGVTTAIVAELPMATINVNAQPWAEVVIDGTPVGATPLANIPIRIGPHRVVLRNPTLGERSETVVIRYGVPNRLIVDMRR